MEIWRWRHRHVDIEHGEMETSRCGNVETWRHGDMEPWTWRHRHEDIKQRMENGIPGNFPHLFAHCTIGSLLFVPLLTKKRTEVIHLQMD
jgi:hypothetical protein